MSGAVVDVRFLLEQWGRWAATGRPRLGYPSATPFRRLLGSTVASAQIDDSTACWVDALVGELAVEHPREAAALALTHVCGFSSRKVAGHLSCSQRAALALLERAEFWVEGRMTSN